MAVKQHVCGVLVTMTTYGTWLRGDVQGWVEDGQVFPSNPPLEAHDRSLLAYPPFLFTAEQLFAVGEFIGRSLIKRLQQRIVALTVQSWHVHFVVCDSSDAVSKIAGCAKEAVRYGLRPGRPIWTAKYDKRFCYDHKSLESRVEYVQRHNTAMGWPARPWPFILPLDG